MIRNGAITMRVRTVQACVTAVVAFVACPRPALAQEFRLLSPPAAFAPAKPPQPFGNLFRRVRPVTPRPATQLKALTAATVDRAAQPRATIACPMRMLPVDPQFDSTMRHAVPENSPEFRMRIAPPLACGR